MSHALDCLVFQIVFEMRFHSVVYIIDTLAYASSLEYLPETSKTMPAT